MEPAGYTMLNSEVDQKGVVRGVTDRGIAWFKDPSGNVLSVLHGP